MLCIYHLKAIPNPSIYASLAWIHIQTKQNKSNPKSNGDGEILTVYSMSSLYN